MTWGKSVVVEREKPKIWISALTPACPGLVSNSRWFWITGPDRVLLDKNFSSYILFCSNQSIAIWLIMWVEKARGSLELKLKHYWDLSQLLS